MFMKYKRLLHKQLKRQFLRPNLKKLMANGNNYNLLSKNLERVGQKMLFCCVMLTICKQPLTNYWQI